jgi:polynucleotide 5'-hydroxyl-kinase GRC3/NOL9
VTVPERELIARVLDDLPRPAVLLLLGANDTGKSTLTLELVRAARERGLAVSVVDADVGQSEIGPPGTIALARVREPPESLAALRPGPMVFVGSVTPAGNLLPVVVGTKRLVERALARGAELVLVDTSGLVEGEIGRALKLHKVELVAPHRVLALQRGEELAPLLRLLESGPARVLRLPVSPQARPKPPGLRRARRAGRLGHYLATAEPHVLDARALPAAGAWLFGGEALAPRHLRFAERALGARVPYGERHPGVVRLVVQGRVKASGFAALREEWRRGKVLLTPEATFRGLMAGLLDADGWLLAAGILESVEFDAARLTVRAPLASAASVRQLRYGRLRLRPDGSEIGVVRPGEL